VREEHVDARGLACPEPVVRTRKAMEQPGVESVCVVVDDDAAVENVRRMAASQGWEAVVEKSAHGTRLMLAKGEDAAAARQAETCQVLPERPPNVVVLLSSDSFGRGEEALGRILIRAFIKTLKELDPRPGAVIFANSGVRLTTEGSELLDDLRFLESQGVRVLSCGTCLDYYKLSDSLAVGVVSNMYEIVSALAGADRVVRP